MSSGIQIMPFGGDGGGAFPMSTINQIGLRTANLVRQIRINGTPHGKEEGTDRGSLVLGEDEYISKVEVHNGEYVDYVKFATNKGRTIGGGGDGGPNRVTLDNIRVMAIGGKAAAWVDKLNIMYVKDYRPSVVAERNAGFILGYAAPSQKLEEYESAEKRTLDSYEKITENMLRTQLSASVEAEYFVKAVVSTEIEVKQSSLQTVKRELEAKLSQSSHKTRTIGSGEVGIELINGTVMKGADGTCWMFPTSDPVYSTIKITDVDNVLDHYDLTGELATQMPGLQKHKVTRNGYVYYARSPTGG